MNKNMAENIKEIEFDNEMLRRYNYVRLPCKCIYDKLTDSIAERNCNFHKSLMIGRKGVLIT